MALRARVIELRYRLPCLFSPGQESDEPPSQIHFGAEFALAGLQIRHVVHLLRPKLDDARNAANHSTRLVRAGDMAHGVRHCLDGSGGIVEEHSASRTGLSEPNEGSSSATVVLVFAGNG